MSPAHAMPAPRPDQSQYLAHFTKGANAFDNIVSILDDKIIRAGTLPWTNFRLNLVKSRTHRKTVLGAFCFGYWCLGPSRVALACCRPKPADRPGDLALLRFAQSVKAILFSLGGKIVMPQTFCLRRSSRIALT